jgi:hypothetical protein
MDESRTGADRSTGSNLFLLSLRGITMKLIRHATALLAGLLFAAATLLLVGPAAFAQPAPTPGDGAAGPVPSGTSLTVPQESHHGSPLWVFFVIAAAAIALTIVAQVLAAKARPVLRRRLARA